MLTASLGSTAGEPIVAAAQAPPGSDRWTCSSSPVTTRVIPALVSAAATAVRRRARVLVAAPFEGPLRDATAGRAAVLAPRLWVPDDFGLCRYLAVGLAVLGVVDPAILDRPGRTGRRTRCRGTAQQPGSGGVHQPRQSTRRAHVGPAGGAGRRLPGEPFALARHGGAAMLRVGGCPVAAAGLADALIACAHRTRFADPVDALFHDEEIDGPLPGQAGCWHWRLAEERPALSADCQDRRCRSGWCGGCRRGRIGTGHRRRAEATTGHAGRAAGDGRGLSETGRG